MTSLSDISYWPPLDSSLNVPGPLDSCFHFGNPLLTQEELVTLPSSSEVDIRLDLPPVVAEIPLSTFNFSLPILAKKSAVTASRIRSNSEETCTLNKFVENATDLNEVHKALCNFQNLASGSSESSRPCYWYEKRPYFIRNRIRGYVYGGKLFDKFSIEKTPSDKYVKASSGRDRVVLPSSKIHAFELSPSLLLALAGTWIRDYGEDSTSEPIVEPLGTYVRYLRLESKASEPNLWPGTLSIDQHNQLLDAFYWYCMVEETKSKYAVVLAYYYQAGWDVRIKEKYERHGRTVLRHPHRHSKPRTSLGPLYVRSAIQRLAELEQRKNSGRPVRASEFHSRGKYEVVRNPQDECTSVWNDLLDSTSTTQLGTTDSKKAKKKSLGRPKAKMEVASMRWMDRDGVNRKRSRSL